MKRFITALLAIVFLSTACMGIVQAKVTDGITDYTQVEIVKNFIDVEIGNTVEAVFVYESDQKSVGRIELFDENGKKLNEMTDNGTKGDSTGRDGIYSAHVTLSSDVRKLVTYAACVDGVVCKEYEVNFYREITESDQAEIQVVYDGINRIESDMEEKGASDNEIFKAVEDYIRSCDCIESIDIDEGISISYTAKSGIASIYGRMSEGTKGAGEPTDEATVITADGSTVSLSDVKDNSKLTSWTNPNVLLVRPYRNVVGEEGFHNDRYIDAANLITGYTGGYVTVLDNEDTTPYRLLETFYQNGFIMVDSHGLTGYGNSYMSVWSGAGYTGGDLSAHRIMQTNTPNHIWVTGTFFQYYYEKENKTLENTFLYFGICYGMTEESLRKPLFELGAVCAYGYDNSVSMGYEGYNVLTMYPYLTTICAEDETRTYNLEEAVAYAIEQNGDTDPYGPYGAHLQMDGDTKFVVYKPDVPLTGVTVKHSSIEGTVGSNCYIQPVLEPAGMVYGYTQKWESSNEEVIEIVGTRVGYAKDVGSAVVTATFTYGGNEYSIECTVTVSYAPPESISAYCNMPNSRFAVGQTRVITANLYPLNCSDSTVLFRSNNPGVVTVDDKGVVSSHRPGKATITAYSKIAPDIKAEVDIEVVTDAVFKSGSEIDYESEFLIVANTSSPAALCCTANTSYPEFLQSRDLSLLLGHYSGNISAVNVWRLKKADGGFYIYNEGNNLYLAQGADGLAYTTEDPLSIFKYENGRISVVNPESDTENIFLRYRGSRGFCFGKSASATKIDFARKVEFSDKSKYVTVTFEDDGAVIATQIVAKGETAVFAVPPEKDGKTFLGFDACLANLRTDVTAKAVYEDGINDHIILTFKDFDGTPIDRVEFKPGESFDIPNAPEHEDMTFTGWSVPLDDVNCNMIVFAMYASNGIMGDVNTDGVVNTGDAVEVLRYAADMITLDDSQLQLADVNGDNSVNTGDAVEILKSIVA